MAVFSKENIEFVARAKHDNTQKMHAFHYHDTHELYFLAHGDTKYFIGSELYFLKPGDMIFIPKGEFHKTVNEDTNSVERLLFSFDDDFVGEDYAPYIREITENKHIRFPKEQIHKMHDIILKIEKESQTREKGYRKMEQLYLRQLLILISRHRLTKNNNMPNETYSIIQDAARYINDNPSKDLSLEALSKIHAMSPAHFSRQFKKITGVGLSEYINITRITAAEVLLLNTSMPITRIADECGFNDSNYFASVFKKIKGITPKKYSALYK